MADDPCAADNSLTFTKLRIASVFIILVTSITGSLVPIALRRNTWIPKPVFEFAKFFGSGVIIATAFIHLLAPAFEELGSPCLGDVWQNYSWAPAIAMVAVYAIFFAEVATYRIGTKKMNQLGLTYTTHNEAEAEHGHDHSAPPVITTTANSSDDILPRHSHSHTHTQTTSIEKQAAVKQINSSSSSLEDTERMDDTEFGRDVYDPSSAEGLSQLIAVAVLEFGVILHSLIIGLTLAVNQEFITLFVVIIFHQMFEGLGLGSRLSQLQLPRKLSWTLYLAGIIYSIMTPLGIAIGLGLRNTYNGNSATANIVSGVLDAFSAGILLYTGLVELLGHEILLNPKMMKASNGKLAYVFACMACGSGVMALLGRWA